MIIVAYLLLQLDKQAITHPQKGTRHASWNAGVCQHICPWLARAPPRWAALRVLRAEADVFLLRLVSSIYCQAPVPLGNSRSLIMINIQLEVIHYQLPPKHLWFWTPDTSPSTPPTPAPQLTEQIKGGQNKVWGNKRGELITHLFKQLTDSEESPSPRLTSMTPGVYLFIIFIIWTVLCFRTFTFYNKEVAMIFFFILSVFQHIWKNQNSTLNR